MEWNESEYSGYFPFWKKLTPPQRKAFSECIRERSFAGGTVLHNGSEDCIGLLMVTEGRLRVYTVPDEGRELTLYRLYDRDMCLLSASCIVKSIRFDVSVEAEEDTVVLHIPADAYRKLMEESAPVANYTNELMAEHFSDVMWLMDQVLNKKLDSRLSALLLEESSLRGTPILRVTHEQLARHLGSVREVVSRMLKYFQNENLVKLTRGGVELLDEERLKALAAASLR